VVTLQQPSAFPSPHPPPPTPPSHLLHALWLASDSEEIIVIAILCSSLVVSCEAPFGSQWCWSFNLPEGMRSSGSPASLRLTFQGCYSTASGLLLSLHRSWRRPGCLESHFKASRRTCTLHKGRALSLSRGSCNSAVHWAPWEGGGIQSAVLLGLLLGSVNLVGNAGFLLVEL
jgi:hypothetical protein